MLWRRVPCHRLSCLRATGLPQVCLLPIKCIDYGNAAEEKENIAVCIADKEASCAMLIAGGGSLLVGVLPVNAWQSVQQAYGDGHREQQIAKASTNEVHA